MYNRESGTTESPFDGLAFRANVNLPRSDSDVLGALTVATSLLVMATGNLLLFNSAVLVSSASITAVCLGALLLVVFLLRLTGSLGWALATMYLLLAIVGVDPSGVSRVMFLLACVVSALAFATRVRVTAWKPVLAASSLATLAILGCDSYTSFDMLQRAALGDVHQDTVFHASIAAMLKNYGAVSTGLNGLVETPYHFFSHLLVAGISRLSGQGVLEVYGVGPWVLFSPVLFLCLTSTCVSMRMESSQTRVPQLWAFSAALLALVPFLLHRWALWNHFFTSESYLVSLGLFLAGMPALIKRPLTLGDVAGVLILATLMGATKASVGLVYVGLWLVRAVLWGRDSIALAIVVLSGAGVAFVVKGSAAANAGTITLRPLDFVQASSLGRYVESTRAAVLAGQSPEGSTLLLALVALGTFVIVHFWPSWVVVVRSVRSTGVRGLLHAPVAVYSLASAAAGLGIVALFGIPGGSAYYFTNVAFFVSAPAVIAMLTHALEGRVNWSCAWVVGIVILGGVGAQGLYRSSATARLTPAPQSGVEFVTKLLEAREHAPMHAVLMASDGLLHTNPTTRCLARAFVYPAITERPWTNVIEPVSRETCEYTFFGYDEYGIRGVEQMLTKAPVLPRGGVLKEVK